METKTYHGVKVVFRRNKNSSIDGQTGGNAYFSVSNHRLFPYKISKKKKQKKTIKQLVKKS